MEKVFWLMWLADVVGSISMVGIFSCIAACLVLAVSGIYSAVEDEPEALKRGFVYVRWLCIPIFVAVITPNYKTVQLMAIASAGEFAANTKLGTKGLEAIEAVLDSVIKKSNKE